MAAAALAQHLALVSVETIQRASNFLMVILRYAILIINITDLIFLDYFL